MKSLTTNKPANLSSGQLEQHLISIIRTNFDGDANHLEDILSEIDWSYLFKNKLYGNLLPLVYFTLKENNLLNNINPEFKSNLENLFQAMSARNRILLKELAELIKTLNTANIEIMVFKGATLAEKVYPHIALRPMGDIDLLLRSKEDASAITAILESKGYSIKESKQEDIFIDSIYCAQTFVKTGKPRIAVDVHYTLPYLGYKKDNEGLDNFQRVWQRGTKEQINGQEVWFMSSEDSIANLMGHNFRHKKRKIITYFDVGFLIKTQEIDWERVASSLEFSLTNLYAEKFLKKAKDEFGFAIPQSVLDELNNINKNRSSFDRILNSNLRVNQLNFLEKFTQTQSFKEKILWLTGYIFPSKNYMEQAYKTNNKFYLISLYIYRPFFIFLKSFFLIIKFLISKIRYKLFKSQAKKPK